MHRFGNILQRTIDGALIVAAQESIYSKDAILKTCYLFTDRCYMVVRRLDADTIEIDLAPKDSTADVGALAGDFCNEMIDQRLRDILSHESGKIRELMVAQAFAEGDLLDGHSLDSECAQDPFAIGDSGDHASA